MQKEVKRRYDASGRQARSAETRSRILDSARELFLANGYQATTVAGVAKGAGVNADTVYALVGRKPVLLRELIEQAISGTEQAVPAEERGYVQAIRAEADPARKLTLYARAVRQIQERMGPLFLALRDAAATDPEAMEVWRSIGARRAANMRKLVADVAETGALRPGVSVEQAADTVWVLNSSELYVLLVGERGWTPEDFEHWLSDSMQRFLLR